MDTTSFSEIAALDEFKNLPKEEKLKATQKYWDEFAASDPANIDNALKLKEFATQYVEADDLVKDAASVEARMAKVDRDVYAFKMTMGEASLRGEITPEEYEAESTTFEEELKARQEQVNKAYEIDRPENRGVVTAAAKAALEAGVFGEQALRPALGMSFPGAPIPTTTDADVALRQRYDKARSILSEQFNLEPEEADDLVKHQLGLQKDPVSRDAFGTIHFKDDLLARSTSDIEAAVKESSLPERVKARTIDGLGDRVQNYKKGIVSEAAQYHKELAADIKLDPEGDPDKEYKKITDALQETRLGQTGGGVLGYALGRLGGFGSTFAAAPGYVATPMGGVTVTPPIEGKELEQVRESMKAPAKKQESINALSDRINQEKVRILGTNAAVVGQGIGSAIESIAIGALTGGVGTALISADRIAKAGKFGQVALGFGQRALNTAPVAGYFGAGQALDTYESAVKAGKSPMEAAKLAATSGAVEFGVTTLFGGMKLGGLEDIRLRFANPEVRRQLAKTVARSWREFGFGTAKGMVGEISEELSITALDSVLVQAEINPNMTVEDFKKSLTDTLVATAFSSGPLTTLSEAREQGRGLLRATQGEFTPVDVTPAERRADELLDSAEQAAPEAAAAARSVLDAQGQPISSAPPVLPPPAGFETTPPPAGFETTPPPAEFETTPPPDVARDQRDSAILSRVTPEEARLGGLPARVLGREEFSIQRPQRGLLGIRRDPETLGGRMDFFFESREAAQPLLDQLTRAGFSNGINNIGGGLVWVNAKDISGGTQNLENFLGLAKTPTVTPSISPTPLDVTAPPTQEVIPEVPVAQGIVPPPSPEGVGEVAEAAPPAPLEGTPAVEAPIAETPIAETPGTPVTPRQVNVSGFTGTTQSAADLGSTDVFHSGNLPEGLASVDTMRVGGAKQSKKKRTYGGFYVGPEETADRYAGTKYRLKLKNTAQVLVVDRKGAIERLSLEDRRALIDQGVDIISGIDSRGAPEQVILNRDAIESVTEVTPTVTPEAPAPLTPGQPVNVTLDDGTTAPGLFRGYDSSGNPQVSTLADTETVFKRRNAQVTPISPTPTPTPQPDATQERSIEESRQPERQDADEGGTPAETSGGDITEPSREKQKEDEVTAENLRKAQPNLTPEQAEVAAKVFQTVAPDIGGALRLGAPPTAGGETLAQKAEAAQKNFKSEKITTTAKGQEVKLVIDNKVTSDGEPSGYVRAFVGDKEIGYMPYGPNYDNSRIQVGDMEVSKSFRRKGVATSMFNFARENGVDLRHYENAGDMSVAGKAFADSLIEQEDSINVGGETLEQGAAERTAPSYAEIMARYKDTPSTEITPKKRVFSPIIRDLLQRRKDGENIPRDVLARAVNEHFPSKKVKVPKSMADLPSQELILEKIDSIKREKHLRSVDAGLPEEGTPMEIRQDVPAMTDHNLGVVTTTYEKAGEKNLGLYLPAVRISNPNFNVTKTEKLSEKIALGKGKGPHITITGTWLNDQSMPSDLATWTQVGFNPDRHSYYYERGTDLKVIKGDEAFQIGNTVFVKNPVYADQAETLYQEAPQQQSEGRDVQGQITFAADMGTAWVELMKEANPTTFYHELAHFLRRFTLDENVPLAMEAAARRGITREEIRDLATWAGVKDGKWTRQNEEKFARAFEKYLLDGKAPNAGLQGMFAKISTWMKEIYTSVIGSEIDIEITDTVRKIFDKLFTGPTSRTLTTPIYGTTDLKVVGYSWDENGNVSFTVQDGLGNETQVSREQLQDTLKPKTSAAKAALGEFARKAKRNAVILSRGENQYFTDEELETTGQEASTEADTPQTIIAKAKKDIRELADQINTFNQAATKAFNRGAFDDQKQLLGLAEEARIELTRLRKNLAEYEQDNPTAPAPPMSKVARAIYAKVRDNDSFPVINALFGKNIKRKALNEKLTGYDGYIPIDGLKSVGSPAGTSAAKELLRKIYSSDTRVGVSPDQVTVDELSGEPNNIQTADEMWAALFKELSRVAKGDVTNENDQEAWMEENGATIEAENAKIADQNQKFSDAVEYGQESIDLGTLNVGDRLMINGIMVEVTSVNTDKTGFSDELESIDIDGGLDFGVQRVGADQDLRIDLGGFLTKERYEAGAFSEEFKTAQDSQEADRVRDEYLDQMAENIRATNEEERNTSPISMANGETLGEPLEYNEENIAAFDAIQDELERTKFMARMMVSMLEKARAVKGTEEIDYTTPEDFNENEYFSLQEGIANPLLEQAGGVVPPPSPRRQFGLLYDAAMAAEVAWKTSGKDGTAGTRLLNSLIEGIDQVRVLRDIEIAHLTLEGVARRDAVNFRSQQFADLLNNPRDGQAYKDEFAKAEINLAEASAKYQEILMYAASARSQSGRSLNAWKFAIKDDYSYASVSAREGTVRLAARRKVDPNATFKFSEEELAELRAYSESQLALQDLLKLKTDARTLSGKDRAAWVENESDAANTIRQLQETILRMEAEKAKGPRNVKGLKKAQESLKAKAELARQRRASKKGVYLNAGFFIDQDTAEAIEDYAIIGADWFFNNALMTLGEFAARLKKEGSQLADTFVDRIYAGAKKNYNREIREFAAQEGRSSEDIIAELDADDTPTRGMVFDLARAFIREGQRDFEVLNSVAAAMSGPFPDLSREDVAILFTNYGKGESVVAPELQAALLTATNLERDTLKLGSLQRGEAPKRSQDMVQREITPKLLDLRTKIQNLQKKMKYDQRDESQELASAHSKSRNRMRNIIAAKRKAVEEGKALESTRMGDKGDLPAENLALQAELDLINEEYNAAFGALTPEEMERRRKLSAHNTAERWIGSMVDVQTDTQKWDVKPKQELNLQKLITDHVREANPEFQAQAVAFGVTEEQARVMDALANHERKSRETFKETKKKLRKEEVAEREAARRQPGAVADALIKRFSERMLDSSQLKRDSKPTSEVTLLTRSHLKEAIPDFVDVMVGLGATRDQAEALDGLINAEREKIASLKTITVKDRNAILEKSLDRQIQAEQDLINQGLVKAIENGEKNPAETEAVLSRRKALKELRLLKYELYEAANPGQLATNQAFKDVNDAITRRQKTLAELESGLVAEKKEKKDRTEGVNVTQELQDQWDTSDRLDVLITSLRREKAKLPDTPSQTARKIEASLKLAESALARNEKRIANNDILPRATTESPASKDARVKEVRGRNKELLNLIVEMQREQQIGSFSPAARLARQLGTSQKILDELNEANRTGVYPKKKERPKPLDDRDLDMIRFKIDRARELRDANLAQQLWNETRGWRRRKEQLIALLRFRQMFSLTGDVGNPSRQLGPARLKFLRNDILKLITAAWNPATRQDIRENGLITQRWLTAIARAAKSDEVEFESYSKFLNHPDYMRRAKLGFQLLRPGEFSAELGKGDTARLNPMNLFPWWAIGVAATIKATLRASIQAMNPADNVSIFDFASTVAVGFGALKAAKVLERMNRVALNVGRWEVQNLMDQKSLAENYFGWERHEEYEKDMIRVTNTFSGRGTLEGQNIGPAFEGAVNLLSIVSDHPRWRLSRIMVAFGQPLFQLKFGGPKEKRAAAYKVAENYFDMFAGAALNMYLTYLVFGLTPMTSIIMGLVSGKGDEDDEEENRKKRERIEKLTYPVSHYLDPKFGAMRVGDVYFDDLSGATKYLSFLMRVLSDTKLDPAAREQGINREIPIEAYDKRKMISDFLAGHLNRNAQFGIEALVMGEYRTGGPVGDLPLGTAVLATMDAFTVNATLRDMGKIYDKLGDVDGTIAIAQLLGGIGVSPAETGRERDIRIAKERRLAAEEARRRRQAE